MSKRKTLFYSSSSDSPMKSEEATSTDDSRLIVSAPYRLAEKSALFRERHADTVGCTIQAANLSAVRIRTNAQRISDTIAHLGFTKVSENNAADSIQPTENKLNWAILISKDNNSFGGPNIILMKPFVSRMYLMCNKWHLVRSLSQVEKRMQRLGQPKFLRGSGQLFSHREFIPFTINMNSKTLEQDLVEQPGTYLAKPCRGSMGERMQLVHIRETHVQADLLSFLLTSEFTGMRRDQVILQRYIERPLLIDKRKFDMRVYLLVVNPKRGGAGGGGGVGPGGDQTCESGYFAFHHAGFVRLCSAPYDPNNADISVHLTNQSVQAKEAKTFRSLKEVTTWYPDELNAYLNKRRRITERQNWARDVLYPKVGAILGYIATLYRYCLDDKSCQSCTFRILGVDMLVDEQLRVYLLEFNELPAWGLQTSVLGSIKPNLWRETICLVGEVVARYRSGLAIEDDNQLVTRQNFRLVYSSDDEELARRNIARLY